MPPRSSWWASGSAGRAAPGRGGQPALVAALVDHPDPEDHVRVLEAAELGALAVVQPDLVEGEVELVVGARDGLALEQRLGHVEGVDHVGRDELDPDRLADRHDHLGDAVGGAEDLGPGALVGEAPAPLEGGHGHPDVGLARLVQHLVLGLEGEDEQHQHDHRGDQGPEKLKAVVAVGLLGQLVVAAPVADHRPDDQPRHHHEDDRGDVQEEVVEVLDGPSLLGDALGDAAAGQEGGDRHGEPAGGGSATTGLHGHPRVGADAASM